MISSTEKTFKVISANCDCVIDNFNILRTMDCVHETAAVVLDLVCTLDNDTAQAKAKGKGKGKARSAAPALANKVKGGNFLQWTAGLVIPRPYSLPLVLP